MLKNSLTLLLVTLQFTCYAQFKVIGEATPFEEYTNGYGKFLILKNGNTVFCTQYREKLNIKIFSPAHKLVKDIAPNVAAFNQDAVFVKAIFEVNNEIVLLIISRDKRTRILSRVVINGSTGVVKEDKELTRLDDERILLGKTYAALAIEEFFWVHKDPYSDQYAVVAEPSGNRESKPKLECIWYGGNHKEITRATFSVPQENFDFVQYLDMVIVGDRQLTMLVKSGEINKKNKIIHFYIATLQKNQQSFAITSPNIPASLELSNDLFVQSAMIKQNPVAEKFIMLTNYTSEKEEGYIPLITYINVATNKIEYTGLAIPEKAIQASASIFGDKKAFSGLPQDIIIADDGRFTVILEEKTNISSDRSFSVALGNLAIINYDMLGGNRGSYFIPKSQVLGGYLLKEFYMHKKELEPTLFLNGNQYKRTIYIEGKSDFYTLFNDIEKNEKKMKDGKLSTIAGVGEIDGFSYRIEGAEPVPSRKPVFGLTGKKSHHYLGSFSTSAYDKNTNQLATIRLEINGSSKNMQVVWLEPN
ncbi:MAG: hypothetical protein JST63_06400 [Bacteroidetes bacterium]|nr:hypothetical protein [Bacteroidota bacterium]